MMRHTVILALILMLTASHVVVAQGLIPFAGSDVVQLAQTIVTQSKETGELPASYLVPIGEKGTATVTAQVAFEILARCLAQWSAQKNFPMQGSFPSSITGVTWSLQGPAYDPVFEPQPGTSSSAPALTMDIITMAPKLLAFAHDTGNNIISTRVTFPARNQLTAAQYLLAMAMIITEFNETGKLSQEAIAVLPIRSPKSWADASNPISIIPVVIIEPVSLNVSVNGTSIPKDPGAAMPPALSQPLCGQIRIVITCTGPIATTTLAIDGQRVASFDKAGTHGHVINSALLTDEAHMIAVTATDEDGKTSPIVFSLVIRNGRASEFTPADAPTTAKAPAPTPGEN